MTILNPNLQTEIYQYLKSNLPEVKEIVIPEFLNSDEKGYPKVAFKEVGEQWSWKIRYMFVVRAETIKEATEIARKIEQLMYDYDNPKIKWVDIDWGINQWIDEKSWLKEVFLYILVYTADSI